MNAASDLHLSTYLRSQCKQVVPPPTEHASNGAQQEHAQQAVERIQFRWFKFHRITTRALPMYPEKVWQPIVPVEASVRHFSSSFIDVGSRRYSAITSSGHEFSSNHESSARMLPVAIAMHESAAP